MSGLSDAKQRKVGAVLSYIIIALNMLVGLVYTPLLVHGLGQSEYGLYSLVASVILYLTVLDLGFGNAIIVYTAKLREKGDATGERSLHGAFFLIYCALGTVAFIIGIIVSLNASQIFAKTLSTAEQQQSAILLMILSFNVALSLPFGLFTSILTAYEKFVFNKVLNIAKIILTPIIMLPLLYFGFKSVALVIVTTIVNIFLQGINIYYCFSKIKIKLSFKNFNTRILKEVFLYSFFIFLNIIIDRVNWALDQFILGAVCSTVAVAVYSVAAQLNQMYFAFSTSISSILLPKVSRMEERGASDEEFTDIFVKIGRIQYIVLALIVSGFAIFGQHFMQIWMGSDYVQSYYIACILMIPSTIPLIQNVGLSILQAKNKYKYRTMIFFFIAILNVIISLKLAPFYEGVGTAIGTAVSLILGQILILNIYYHKSVHINMIRFWREILTMTVPVAITIGAVLAMKHFWVDVNALTFICQIAIMGTLYCGLMWLLGMNQSEKELVRDIWKRISGMGIIHA